jgi:hypothetical protein
MNLESLPKKKRTEKITEWVTGGAYAVAVEVEAIFLPERPTEPYLTPETVRFLEKVEGMASAGDLAALKKIGRVYVQLDQAGATTTEPQQRADGKAAR